MRSSPPAEGGDVVAGWKAVVGIALILVFGFMSGVAATVLYVRFIRAPDRMAAAISRQLTRELDLDAGQQAVMREAVEDARRELLALRAEMKPRADEILGRSRRKIEGSLREDQRRRFEKLLREREALRRRLWEQ